jgi:hypothetical protein
MLCYGLLNKRSPLTVLRFSTQTSSLAPCGKGISQIMSQTMMSFPHSTEQDTLPIVFLISRQVIPYRTCGGTCCSGVSTPKIQSLAESSTTCHDSINHLYHFNHCSNHSTDPHHGKLTSRCMEDHNTLTKTQAKLNITKDGRLV